jgi:hypothetical protein
MLKGRYDAVVAVSDADVIRAMGMAADRLGLIGPSWLASVPVVLGL